MDPAVNCLEVRKQISSSSPRAKILAFADRLARRLSFLLLLGAVFFASVSQALDILKANGFTALELVLLSLFVLSISLVCLSFAYTIIGFLVFALAKDPIAAAAPIAGRISKTGPLSMKTAVIMPVYNEDFSRVLKRFRALYRSLESLGVIEWFGFFILSDTSDSERGKTEQELFDLFKAELGEDSSIFYRRRTLNTSRKVGNIRDFCDRWGGDYECMVTLDADSIISGETVLWLARIMEAHPEAGLVQTTPLVVLGRTPFARIMQFGHRLCGEMLSAGAGFWQLSEGNYYGHNAIVRIRPFVEHCKLPVLRGKGPLSGEIFSHDFVEGAYLRRSGYQIWVLPSGEGSYEELPSNLLDYAKRDRRWCQGNLQHSRLLFTRGFYFLSRLHLFLGIMAYVSSPIWMLLLLLSLAKLSYEATVGPVYFTHEYALFPEWPETKTFEAVSLFCATFVMLLAPKILGSAMVIYSKEAARSFAGRFKLILSLSLEIIFSVLLAPVMMVFNSMFVFSILCGRSVAWTAQDRQGRALGIWETTWCLRYQILLGILMAASVGYFIPEYIWWILPILLGLFLGVPLTVASSSEKLGLWLKKRGLFTIPEETLAPPEVAALLTPGGE